MDNATFKALKNSVVLGLVSVVDPDEKYLLAERRLKIQEEMKLWQEDFLNACREKDLDLPEVENLGALF